MYHTREEISIGKAARLFFQSLEAQNVIAHPQVFTILDEIARENGYKINQLGIGGTRLSFDRNTGD